MPGRDARALDARDKGFETRIRDRDESVLREIDRACRGRLYRLLSRFDGPRLTREDFEDIANAILLEVWQGFRIDGGLSVRSFYFLVGKRRAQDLLRSRRRREYDSRLYVMASVDSSNPTPEDAAVFNESVSINQKIRRHIENGLSRLTQIQRTAFLRAGAAGGGEHWAVQLERETGRLAQRWRKEASVARKRIKAYLEGQGVRYSREGGHYEIATSAGPA